MAVFYKKKENKLEAEYKALKAKQMRFRTYCVYALILFAFNIIFGPSLYGAFTVVGHIGSFGLFAYLSIRSNAFGSEARIVETGIEGERTTNEILSNLPDTYHIVPNVELTVEGKHSEMDTVVVGPTGVFIVEAKSRVGDIYADLADHDWIQQKTTGGGIYKKSLYSPAKQVATHAYRLSTFLKSKGIFTWVQGTVFVANTDCNVEITVKDAEVNIPVFSVKNIQVLFPDEEDFSWHGSSGFKGETNILKYIAYNKKQTLTDEQVMKIVNLIK